MNIRCRHGKASGKNCATASLLCVRKRNAVSIAAEALAADMPQLTQSQRRKLTARIEKAIEELGQLADSMKNGEKSNDGAENSSD